MQHDNPPDKFIPLFVRNPSSRRLFHLKDMEEDCHNGVRFIFHNGKVFKVSPRIGQGNIRGHVPLSSYNELKPFPRKAFQLLL